MTDDKIIRGISSRKRKVSTIKMIDGIGTMYIVFGIPAGLFMLLLGKATLGIAITVIGIVLIPFVIIGNKSISKKEKELKAYIGENVVKEVLAERLDIIKYTPDNFINEDYIKKCKILPNYDRISGSDYVKAKYKGVELVYSDLMMEREYERERDGRKSKYYKTVFKGNFLKLDMTQDINGFVRIRERKTPRKEKGFLHDVLSGASDVLGVKTEDYVMEVENVEFNEQFEIKSNNHEMAFYILTPQFLESIVRADQLGNGYTNIDFTDKTLNIAINNGLDSFELTKSVHTKKGLEEYKNKIRKDLSKILMIVDQTLTKEKLF